MKTKHLIREQARMLFNRYGIMNITLRDVASALGKSYGNVTYHYKNKQQLILAIYRDLSTELKGIQPKFDSDNLLKVVLEAPRLTFAIALRYAFFYADFIELKRNFNEVSEYLKKDNMERKTFYLNILKQLQYQQILRSDLEDQDLDYLMDLSGIVRSYFFIDHHPADLSENQLREKFVKMVNQLLYPYLSAEGINQFRLWQKS